MRHDDAIARLMELADAADTPAGLEALRGALLEAAPDAIALVAFHRRLAELGAADDTLDAPAAVVRRAVGLMTAPRGETGVVRILARLLFDSRTASVALREDGAEGYRVSFAADDLDIDLAADPLDPAHRRWRLTGQVSGAAGGVAVHARLHDADGVPSTMDPVVADERGYFVVELPRGRWTAEVQVGDRVIELAELEME